jgi:hypothetical protein
MNAEIERAVWPLTSTRQPQNASRWQLTVRGVAKTWDRRAPCYELLATTR